MYGVCVYFEQVVCIECVYSCVYGMCIFTSCVYTLCVHLVCNMFHPASSPVPAGPFCSSDRARVMLCVVNALVSTLFTRAAGLSFSSSFSFYLSLSRLHDIHDIHDPDPRSISTTRTNPMAAAVQAAPHHGLGQPNVYDQHYHNSLGGDDVPRDADGNPLEEDMEAYYADREYHHQLHAQQQHAQQAGMAYQAEHDDDQDDDEGMYSDDSSEESVLPDENIDFGLIYALHTFLATVEGQASVVKGDSLLLLDDANSYWWLVRVLKTEDVGYIPAENIETPYERLARLNKHRNIDVAAPTAVDSAAVQEVKRDGKLKTLIGWGRRGSAPPPEADGEELEEREGRRVYFAPPTYVEHPGVTWSDDGEEDGEEGEAGEAAPGEDDSRRRAALLDDVDHILDMEADMEDPSFADYETEPDDGVEWAQDAVQALRNADGGAVDAPADVTSDSHAGAGLAVAAGAAAVGAGVAAGAAASHVVTPGAANLSPQASSRLAAIAGVTPPMESTEDGKFAPPDRSPSPKAPGGLAARTNPTPPPGRGPAPLTTMEASPEPDARHATPGPTSPATRQSPPTRHQKALSNQSIASSVRSSASSYGVTSPKSPTPASPATPGAPRSLARGAPKPPTQWYSDAFDIKSFNALVRARALDIKRNTPVPRPRKAFLDDVQSVFYGNTLDFETLQPDLRAPYVHVQAKMDAFDRDIDNLLGSLVAIR